MVGSVTLTSAELQTWLEWASARLLATPSQKIKPEGYSSLWPEYSQDKFEILNFRVGIALRALAPSSDEIPIMDEILLLPNLCSNQTSRRIIRLHSLINPINNRRVYKWPEIAKKIEVKQYTAKRLYTVGLAEVTRKIDNRVAQRIFVFLQEQAAYMPSQAKL